MKLQSVMKLTAKIKQQTLNLGHTTIWLLFLFSFLQVMSENSLKLLKCVILPNFIEQINDLLISVISFFEGYTIKYLRNENRTELILKSNFRKIILVNVIIKVLTLDWFRTLEIVNKSVTDNKYCKQVGRYTSL